MLMQRFCAPPPEIAGVQEPVLTSSISGSASAMAKLILLLTLSLVVTAHARADVKVEKIAYKGWRNCYQVSNGEVALVVTSDVGPRIISFGFVGGQNLFKEFSDQLGGTREEKFQLRGGDRVWKAPEDPVATWAPDNMPVEITITPNGLIAKAPVEPLTSLQKEIEVRMAASGTEVIVLHRITNRSFFPLEYSAWALTMMAPGGIAITGFPPRGKHPANLEATILWVLWPTPTWQANPWSSRKNTWPCARTRATPERKKWGRLTPTTWAPTSQMGVHSAFVARWCERKLTGLILTCCCETNPC